MIKDVSTNGTLLNSIRIAKNKEYILAHGDEITIGSGIAGEEVKFVITFPGISTQQPTDGVHAQYDMRAEVLGQGAFAVVKKAIERTTGNFYAVKIIDKKKVMSGVAVEREIDILKKLKHEFIVGLKDFFEDGNNYYLIMDLVSGGDLMDFVTNNGPIPEEPAREITRQVLCALQYVHSLGISHRDIKPDNVLIAQDEPVIVRISDFGLAKLTKSGSSLQTFCGTLAYLAPEIMRKKHSETSRSAIYSNKVDIWSVGCMLYVILTGYLPFNNNTQYALYQSVLSGNFCMEPLIEAKVSKPCLEFLRYVLDVDPNTRPSSEQALQHPWFTTYTFDEEASQKETAESFTAPPEHATKEEEPKAVPAPKSISIKRQPSTIHSKGIRNPDDFPSMRVEPKIDDVPDVPDVPNAYSVPDLAQSSDDIIMTSPGKENEHIDLIPEGHNGNGPQTSQQPTTQKVGNAPVKKPLGNARNGQENNADDSDEDNDEIRKVADAQIKNRVNQVNSLVQSSLNHNNNSNSSPYQVRPYISVVRDMDNQNGVDMPIGTWMILRTLNTSIPHEDVCLTLPILKFGRSSEYDNVFDLRDSRVSKMHACIAIKSARSSNDSPSKDGMYKIWLGDWSRNGCYLNGEKIGKGRMAQLQDRDILYFFQETKMTEFLGFEVVIVDSHSFVERPTRDKNVFAPFAEDPIRFKGWVNTTSLGNASPGLAGFSSSPLTRSNGRPGRLGNSSGITSPRTPGKRALEHSISGPSSDDPDERPSKRVPPR